MPSFAILEESTEMLTCAEESLTILGTEFVHADKEMAGTWSIFCSFLIFLMIFFEYRFVCVYFKNVNNKLFNCLSLSTILGVCRQ